MRKVVESIGGLVVLGVLACTTSRADDLYPQSFVNIHGNASSLAVSNNFYDNNGYYNNYNSNSQQGGGGGAALRFVIPGGFMFDASYNTDEASIGSGDVRINQGTAGLGYRAARWYVEGMFTTFQPKVTSNFQCGGPCASITYNGGGAKGGFVWTFGHQWYATVDTGLAVLGGPSGTNSIVQGILGGSIGYNFNPNFSVDLGALSNAWVFGNSNNNNNNGYNTTISVTSLQAGISLHF
jgi:hypothetical protein